MWLEERPQDVQFEVWMMITRCIGVPKLCKQAYFLIFMAGVEYCVCSGGIVECFDSVMCISEEYSSA